jgi:hypothetical protein
MTIDPDDEVLVDLRGSCTKDEAVAKLIGWNRGPFRKRYIQLAEGGIPRDQWPHIYTPDEPLHEQLRGLREQALRRFYSAYNDGASEEELDACLSEVDAIDSIINQASAFMIDIEDECAMADRSRLRIDPEATRETGITHLTVASIDAWAREKYAGLSIYGDAVATVRPAPPATEKQRRQRKLENLFTTFAFALDALADQPGRRYRHEGGALNVKALAEDLSARSKQANNNQVMKEQSAESIKDRIEEAIKTKRSHLPLK